MNARTALGSAAKALGRALVGFGDAMADVPEPESFEPIPPGDYLADEIEREDENASK